MVMTDERRIELINIQSYQLAIWNSILTPDAFESLRSYAVKNNVKAERESDIPRGNDLDVYVSNYARQKFEKSKKEKRLEQYDLQQEVIKKSGINIVTCGNCGSVVLHRLSDEEIQCPDCGFESEPCDFPDLNCV
jgi:predicted RNA-binding Zn-ribbon protein involved in translation (DUF1610 family)